VPVFEPDLDTVSAADVVDVVAKLVIIRTSNREVSAGVRLSSRDADLGNIQPEPKSG
jgi:hypothetical protein